MLTSLLIKFICRYLPYGSKNIDKSNNLFEMLIAKNTNLSKNQRMELEKLKNDLDAKISDAIDITRKFCYKNNLRNEHLERNKDNNSDGNIDNNIENNDDEINIDEFINDDGRF